MTIKISLLKDNVYCEVKEIANMEQLGNCITNGYGWAPGTFTNNYRNLDNFQSMDVIALDFDEGMTLVEAELMFSGYQHIIGTSRSHQKVKMKGQKEVKACDRFRVVLKLSEPIKDDETYKSTFNKLRVSYPSADSQCSDSSRFFFPCVDIISGDNEGRCIEPVKPIPQATKPKRELTALERGKLARSTLEFLTVGTYDEKKGRHASLFKAAKDLQEQGFDEVSAEEILLRCPLVDEPGMPVKDFAKAIKSAYKREPKYEPREFSRGLDKNVTSPPPAANGQIDNSSSDAPRPNSSSLKSLDLLEEALAHLANPEAVKGISTGWKEVDQLLGGLRQAELGILQAYPKSGKTVLLTNIMANLTGMGHGVGFASLEMHPAKQVEPDLYSLLLKKDVRQGVITDEDRNKIVTHLQNGRGFVYFKRDRRPTAEEICDWARTCYREQGIRFFFLDHFHKFVPDESSVASVSKTITALTGLKYECPEMFCLLVVQPTKEQRTREGLAERVGKNTLRGGASIFDEADFLLNLHTKYGSHRETETSWGIRRENVMIAYPNDVRELEFEAIRAKPFSENMGKKIHMKYNKLTTEMTPYKFIAPEIEVVRMPEREDKPRYNGPRSNQQQSGWASDTWKNKKI